MKGRQAPEPAHFSPFATLWTPLTCSGCQAASRDPGQASPGHQADCRHRDPSPPSPLASGGSVVGAPASDRASHRSEDPKNYANQGQDRAERVEDADVQDGSDNDENDSENDHVPAITRFAGLPIGRGRRGAGH